MTKEQLRVWLTDYASMLQRLLSEPDIKPKDWEKVNARFTEVVQHLRAPDSEPAVAHQKYQTLPGVIDGPCIHCKEPFFYHWQDAKDYAYYCRPAPEPPAPTNCWGFAFRHRPECPVLSAAGDPKCTCGALNRRAGQ